MRKLLVCLLVLLCYATAFGDDTTNPLSLQRANRIFGRLDGATTTGIWNFGNTIKSTATSGCTVPTTITYSPVPVAYGGNNYTFMPGTDPYPDGCGSCSNGLLMLGVSDEGPVYVGMICCDHQTSIELISVLSYIGPPNDVRACLLSSVTGGFHLEIITHNTCETIAAVINGFLGVEDTAIDAEDDDYFKWNATTCSYDFDLETGWTPVTANCGVDCSNQSFPSAGFVTEDSVPKAAWSIDTSGNALFGGTLEVTGTTTLGNLNIPVGVIGIGPTPIVPVTGTSLWVQRNETDHTKDAKGLQFTVDVTPDDDTSAAIAGFIGSAYIHGTHDVAGSYGGSVTAAAGLDYSGTANYINGLWGLLANFGPGLITGSQVEYLEIFVMGDGNIEDSAVIKVEQPGISATHSGNLVRPVGVHIRDQSNFVDITRVIDAVGIKIEPFSDPTDWGIYCAPKSYFGGQVTLALPGGGVSPLAVTSTVKCTNLNADLLDGRDDTYFATSTHTHPYLDGVLYWFNGLPL